MLSFTGTPTNNPYGAYAYGSIMLNYSVQQMHKDGTVDAAWHKKFSGYMVTALTAGQTFHQSVMTYKPGAQPIPVDVVMLTSAMRSAAEVAMARSSISLTTCPSVMFCRLR